MKPTALIPDSLLEYPIVKKSHLTHWYILGAGSIGCLWTSKLLQSGFNCTVLLRPKRVSQLASLSHSLTLTENGETTTNTVDVCAAGCSGTIENLLITTKAQDALSAIQSVSKQLSPNATIVLLQNGMGSQQAITESFPEHAIYAGSTTDGAWLSGFLNVQRAGYGKTWLGPISTNISNRVQQLTTLHDMDIELTPNIQQKLQEKLAINSVINGLAALHNCKNGDLLLPQHCSSIIDLCDETERILYADGYKGRLNLLETVKHVLRITSENICSTLQDVRHQHTTELVWINGYLLKVAQNFNIEAPSHIALMKALAVRGIK